MGIFRELVRRVVKSPLEGKINRAVGALVTEHYFFLELKKEITTLKASLRLIGRIREKNIIPRAMTVTEKEYQRIKLEVVSKIQKALKIYPKIERETKYINLLTIQIASGLNENLTKKQGQEAAAIKKRVNQEASLLAGNVFLYSNSIREQIIKLKMALVLPSNQLDLVEVTHLINDLEYNIEQTEEWLAALSNDLKKAKELAEKKSQGQ